MEKPVITHETMTAHAENDYDGSGHNGHDHHHKQSFITKYVFSQDHKTIAKQFLITGMIWAFIGGMLSVLFRLQLGFPDQSFWILSALFGKWAPNGHISPDFYYMLITM